MATPKDYNVQTSLNNAGVSSAKTIDNTNTLKKYGIDFSQEEQDNIANIFRDQATGAYNLAQKDFANTMANTQNTTLDTLRRSQAEAVSTGASRGLQAANELSAMLGLQQEASAGSTELQGSYATALSNAQQQAMQAQDSRASSMQDTIAADLASQAQNRTAELDYAANDYARVMNDARNLLASENPADVAMGEYLLKNAMSGNGVWTPESADLATSSISGEATGQSRTAVSGSEHKLSFNSKGSIVKDKTGDNFSLDFDGETIRVQTGSEASASIKDTLSSQLKKTGDVAVYDGKIYIYTKGGNIREIEARGTVAMKKEYKKMYDAIMAKKE